MLPNTRTGRKGKKIKIKKIDSFPPHLLCPRFLSSRTKPRRPLDLAVAPPPATLPPPSPGSGRRAATGHPAATVPQIRPPRRHRPRIWPSRRHRPRIRPLRRPTAGSGRRDGRSYPASPSGAAPIARRFPSSLTLRRTSLPPRRGPLPAGNLLQRPSPAYFTASVAVLVRCGVALLFRRSSSSGAAPLAHKAAKKEQEPEHDDGRQQVALFFGTQTGTTEGFVEILPSCSNTLLFPRPAPIRLDVLWAMDKMKAWTSRLGTRSELLLHLVCLTAAVVAVLGRLQIVQPNVRVCFWQPIFTVGADEHSSRFLCTVAICWKKIIDF